MRPLRALAVAWILLAAEAVAQPVSVPLDRPELTGAIVGRVCRDLDGDGQCSAGEPGMPGMRVVLETGLAALTDETGRYHLAALTARAPDAQQLGVLLLGRHRLALDDRGLPPGSHPVPARATVELPMGGLVLQNFAVRQDTEVARPLLSAYKPGAPSAELLADGTSVRYPLSGQAEPGEQITVKGSRAEVDDAGRYRVWVTLAPGENAVILTATSRRGLLRFFSQTVELVARPEGSVLVLPREPRKLAQVVLPGGEGAPAASGPARVHVEGVPGLRIGFAENEVTVGPEGMAELPLVLQPGLNEVVLTFILPGEPVQKGRLELMAEPRALAVGLLELEASWSLSDRQVRLQGRGAGHAEYRLGDWSLSGELELLDSDWTLLLKGSPQTWLLPRSPEQMERVLDPDQFPLAWGDHSLTVAPNAAGGRLHAEIRHETYGRVGFGTYRAEMEDAEVGRFQRELFGPHADLKLPLGPVKLTGRAFYAPGGVDPVRGLVTAPGHDELLATGGSLYYLGSGGLAAGTESIRVESREGLTGVPLAERHLVRGRDYEIEGLSGRILLTRPLSSFTDGSPLLRTDPFGASPALWLVADYERVLLGGSPTATEGGEAGGEVGPVHVSVGAVRELSGPSLYRLYRARGSLALGDRLALHLEAAKSLGHAVDPAALGVSSDGGLTFIRPAVTDLPGGEALTARLRGHGLSPDGHVDAAFRWRSAGFSDRTHEERAPLRQFSLRLEQPIGSATVALLADDRLAPDPREPFSSHTFTSRTLGISVGLASGGLDMRAELKDTRLTAAPDPSSDAALTGGRTSVGLSARYKLLPALSLSVAHQQTLSVMGEGLGARNDTFTQAGVDVALPNQGELGVRAGYGPSLGPLAWLQGQLPWGADAYYGSYSVDVDGPSFGTSRAVSGARTRLGDTSAVFVEDVAAHDANAVRLSRAVGFSGALAPGFDVSVRYEHGARAPMDGPISLARDAGGVTASYFSDRLRLFGRAELRFERGSPLLGPVTPVDRRQQVFSAGAEWDVFDNLRASGRVNFSDTRNLGLVEAHLIEGTAGLAWRSADLAAVLRYTLVRELHPPVFGSFGERTFQTISLLPTLKGARFSLAAGLHLGTSSEAGSTGWVVSGSLRPSVQVWRGLELAVEGAARSAAPDGGSLYALRGEVGYRIQEQALVAVGYTAFGYSGLGVTEPSQGRQDRLYLRVELSY